MVLYASTRTALILESTVAIAGGLNLMVNAVAEQYANTVPERLEQWKKLYAFIEPILAGGAMKSEYELIR